MTQNGRKSVQNGVRAALGAPGAPQACFGGFPGAPSAGPGAPWRGPGATRDPLGTVLSAPKGALEAIGDPFGSSKSHPEPPRSVSPERPLRRCPSDTQNDRFFIDFCTRKRCEKRWKTNIEQTSILVDFRKLMNATEAMSNILEVSRRVQLRT